MVLLLLVAAGNFSQEMTEGRILKLEKGLMSEMEVVEEMQILESDLRVLTK